MNNKHACTYKVVHSSCTHLNLRCNPSLNFQYRENPQSCPNESFLGSFSTQIADPALELQGFFSQKSENYTFYTKFYACLRNLVTDGRTTYVWKEGLICSLVAAKKTILTQILKHKHKFHKEIPQCKVKIFNCNIAPIIYLTQECF